MTTILERDQSFVGVATEVGTNGASGGTKSIADFI